MEVLSFLLSSANAHFSNLSRRIFIPKTTIESVQYFSPESIFESVLKGFKYLTTLSIIIQFFSFIFNCAKSLLVSHTIFKVCSGGPS